VAVYIAHAIALGIVSAAAVTDTRTGHIPNWLTLPAIVFGPIIGFIAAGLGGVIEAVLGILVCGLVPYLLFRKGAMAGGDVKLFAAVGGLTGIFIGVEAQFLSFIAAGVLALGGLAWRGKLLGTLANTLRLMINPLIPQSKRTEVDEENLNEFRLGGSIFLGTLLALAFRHQALWTLG